MPRYSNRVIDEVNSNYFNVGECIRVWIHLLYNNNKKCLSVVIWHHGGNIILKNMYSVNDLFSQKTLMNFGAQAYDFVKHMENHEIVKRL